MAIDSTKIKGQNAKGRNYSAARVQGCSGAGKEGQQLSGRVGGERCARGREWEARAERGGVKEKIAQLKERQKELRGVASELEQSGASQVSLTDPDAAP